MGVAEVAWENLIIASVRFKGENMNVAGGPPKRPPQPTLVHIILGEDR